MKITTPATQTPKASKSQATPRISYSKRSIIHTPAKQTPPRKA